MEEDVKDLVALWDMIDLGYELDNRYANTGIITSDDKSVVVNITAIEETAKQWNEPIQQFDFEGAFGLGYAAARVNEYMEDPVGYKQDEKIPLVKLIGDRLLQNHPEKQVELDY